MLLDFYFITCIMKALRIWRYLQRRKRKSHSADLTTIPYIIAGGLLAIKPFRIGTSKDGLYRIFEVYYAI